MKNRKEVDKESLIMPKLLYQFPRFKKVMAWKEAIGIGLLTIILSVIGHSPWFEIFVLLEIFYYL